MKHRRLLAIALVVAPTLALVGACAFPDVTFEPADGTNPDGSSPDGSPITHPDASNAADSSTLADGRVDAGAGEDASKDTGAPDSEAPDSEAPLDAASDSEAPDSEAPDASEGGADAGADADAGGPCSCDCDHDGYPSAPQVNGTTCPSPGQLDCDDTDPRAHPGQGYLDAGPVSPTEGDWNCDNTVETLYATAVSCTAHGVGSCTVSGFLNSTVQCGQTTDFVTCKDGLSLTCVNGTTTQQTQSCK